MLRRKPIPTILGNNNNNIIVGQQQMPKIFGKKTSNSSCWMFSNFLALLNQFLG